MTRADHIAQSHRELLEGIRDPQRPQRNDVARWRAMGGEHAERADKLEAALDRINAVFGKKPERFVWECSADGKSGRIAA